MYNKIKKNLVSHKTAIVYSLTSIFKAITTMAVGFIVAKYVSPQDLGLWTSISLALTYSAFIQGGVINGLNLELPYSFGSGQVEKAEKLAGIAQKFTIIISILVFIIGIGFFYFSATNDDKFRYGVLGITVLIVLTFYQSYLFSTFRSNNSFLKLSYIQLAEAAFNFITLFFVVYFAYYGMIIKAILVLLFFTILLHINRPIKAKLYWNNKLFFNLLKIGLPIFVLIILDSLALTVDKLWLLKYTNLEQVGHYTFGLYALNVFILFSSSVASYIYPKMTYLYAQNNDKEVLWKYVKKTSFLLLILQLPILIIGCILIPFLVPIFFPNYIKSIFIMQILLTAGLMKGLVIGVNVLWSMKSWKFMYTYQIIYTILLVIITYTCSQLFNNKAEGVAYGVLIANTLNLVNGLVCTYLATNTKKNEKNTI